MPLMTQQWHTVRLRHHAVMITAGVVNSVMIGAGSAGDRLLGAGTANARS